MANELEPDDDQAPEPPWLAQFIENQKKELAVRAQELELARQQDNHNIEYAKESLAAQERDRKDERDCSRAGSRDRYRLIIWLVLIVAALIGAALYSGHEDIATELVKAIIFIAAGAFGGYGYAANRAKRANDDESS
jgi:cation transport ATPase